MNEHITHEPSKSFERLPDNFDGLDSSRRLSVAGQTPEEIAELYAFPIYGCDPG